MPSLDWTGPTCETVPVRDLIDPSTDTSAVSPTLTELTWVLVKVAEASKDWVPIITMSSVLEFALTVAPGVMPTEAMVPLMGLVSWASERFC